MPQTAAAAKALSFRISDINFFIFLLLFSSSLYLNRIHNDEIQNLFMYRSMSFTEFFTNARPLTELSLQLQFAIHGVEQSSYFLLINVVLYSLIVVLVYVIMLQWINKRGARVATLLFAAHPLHVEAVACVLGRADLLFGLFYCLAVIMYTTSIRAASFIFYGESVSVCFRLGHIRLIFESKVTKTDVSISDLIMEQTVLSYLTKKTTSESTEHDTSLFVHHNVEWKYDKKRLKEQLQLLKWASLPRFLSLSSG